MNKPEFLIRISDEYIACTGAQLFLILKTIYSLIEKFIWYGADIEINGNLPLKH